MKKSKQSNHGLPPLDLRIQDHYEELLTVIKAAKLTGFSKQYIYQQTKSNLLRSCRVKGVMYIKYRHLRSWFIKLPSNHECTFCPASLSLIGLMNLTKRGRCWVLRFVDRYNIRSYYLGNVRRFNLDDSLVAWNIEQTLNPQWITIERASDEFVLKRKILLSIIASQKIRTKCENAQVLVNVKDIKQLKELKQWEE